MASVTMKRNGNLYQIRLQRCGKNCATCKEKGGHPAVYVDSRVNGKRTWAYVGAELPPVDPDYQNPTCHNPKCKNDIRRRGKLFCSASCKMASRRFFEKYKIEHTAYHEAGHAVIAEFFGIDVRLVTAWPMLIGDEIGICRHAFTSGRKKDLRNGVLVAVAGKVATALFTDVADPSLGCDADYSEAMESAFKLSPTPDRYIEDMEKQCAHILRIRERTVREYAKWLIEYKIIKKIDGKWFTITGEGEKCLS